MKKVHVVTIAANNYLPKVRVLISSLRTHHPDWHLHLVVADARPPAEAILGLRVHEVHEVEKLGIPNFRRWAFCHQLIELATAIKPFILGKLLLRPNCDAVVYLDPDIAVFSPLTEVMEALEKNDIVLTPHTTVPETTVEGIVANEIPTMQHGVYNLGFIAVAARETGRAFTQWWADRTYRYCREDIAHGIYTDQRWIDLVPAFFNKVQILRSPGLNCAPWNLSNRAVTGTISEGLKVNGSPLAFFHFSHLGKVPDNRSHGGQPAVETLLSWYRTASRPNVVDTTLPPYAYSAFNDGSTITLEQRLVYRARKDLQRAHPDPFVTTGGGGYKAWWDAYAKSEYPRLFDSKTRDTELLHLSACLSYSLDAEEIVEESEMMAPAPKPSRFGRIASYLRRLRR
jgi:hypothetical protein